MLPSVVNLAQAHGVEHRPVATPFCSVQLFEPATTLNTGEAETGRTVRVLERIG